MYKVFEAVAFCLSLVLSGILCSPAAFAESAWSPRPDWEWIVQGSSGGYYPTLDQACSAYMEEVMPQYVGKSLGGHLIVTRIEYRYVPPSAEIAPPGQCRVLTFVSDRGGPERYHGNDKYFFAHRGRYFITFSPLPPARGSTPDRKSSAERNNSFVGEPVDITSGNVYHEEKVTVGVGRRALGLTRFYNSLGADAVGLGAHWRYSYSQSIKPPSTRDAIAPVGGAVNRSRVFASPQQACYGGWADIASSITGAWATGSHAALDAETGQCRIFHAYNDKVYTTTPIYSAITNRAYYPGSTPIPEVLVSRSDGSRYMLRRINDRWVDNKNAPYRLEGLEDGSGVLTGWRYTTGDEAVETYDAAGKLLSVRSIDDLTTTLSYDGAGRLARLDNDAGNTLVFSYDDQGRIATMTDRTGRRWSYGYDNNNNLVEVSQPDGSARHYRYLDSRFSHALTDIIDERGVAYAHYAYDEEGRSILATRAGGAGRMEIAYDDVNGTRTVTNGEGVKTRYQLYTQNAVPLVARVDGPGCPRCENGHYRATFYKLTNALLSDTENGITSRYGDYDESGNPGYRIEAYGSSQERRTDYTYDGRFPDKVNSVATPSVSPGRHKVRRYQYDDYGNVIRKAVSGYTPAGVAISRITTYAYNGPFHQLSKVDGPRTDVSDVTTYAYDDVGNLAKITDALGHVVEVADHDALGRPLRILDPNGRVTELAYDDLGRLVARSKRGEKTTFSYDPAGDLARITLADGSYITYAYDDARRLVGLSDQLGNRIVYAVDSRGNHIQETRYDPDGTLTRKQTFVYNSLNRLMRVVGAEGQATVYVYDAHGNRRKDTDPLSHAATRAFDALNRLVRISDAVGGAIDYSYDNGGYLNRIVDPAGHATTYLYDDLGNLLEVNSPDSGVTRYEYDAAGNVIATVDASGRVTHYSYDALNRLIGVSGDDGSTATYTYDIAPNGIGRVASVRDSTGQVAWSYDSRGRVVRKQETMGGRVLTVLYRYDPYGRLIDRVYPSGNVVEYAYKANGRVDGVSVNGRPLLKGIRYRPFGAVAGWTWGNGTPYVREHDLDGRIIRLSVPAGTRTITYDRAGRATNVSDANRTVNFFYDEVNRIVRESDGQRERTFQYDSVGNRLKRMSESGITAYYYSAESNRLVRQTGNPARIFSYDPNGNLTADGEHVYSYDASNRLVSVDGSMAAYNVNTLGQRVGKKVVGDLPGNANNDQTIDKSDFDLVVKVILRQGSASGDVDCNRDNLNNVQDLVCINRVAEDGDSRGVVETNLFYDRGGQVIGEYGSDFNPLEETIFFQDMPVGLVHGHVVDYIFPSRLGAPYAITDESNVPVWRWDNDAFGGGSPGEDPDGNGVPFRYNLRLPGQYYDRETESVYNYFRQYDPASGRYWQSDPLGLAPGGNPYIYAYDNPVRYTDRYGLWAGLDDLLFAGSGAVVGVVGTGISDLISWRLSGWRAYSAAAAGGAVGGEALLYTGNPLIAGGAGGLATNLIDQGLEEISGTRRCVSWRSAIADTVVGTATGLVPGPGRLLPGVTSGRGSYMAISRQIMTKFRNGEIGNVRATTAAKITLAKIAEGVPGSGAAGVAALPFAGTGQDCGCSRNP